MEVSDDDTGGGGGLRSGANPWLHPPFAGIGAAAAVPTLTAPQVDAA